MKSVIQRRYGAPDELVVRDVERPTPEPAEVTAMCSAGKADLARSLRANHVVDYTKTDFTRDGVRYTGRAWLGQGVEVPGHGVRYAPLTGDAAERSAEALGFEREGEDCAAASN